MLYRGQVHIEWVIELDRGQDIDTTEILWWIKLGDKFNWNSDRMIDKIICNNWIFLLFYNRRKKNRVGENNNAQLICGPK